MKQTQNTHTPGPWGYETAGANYMILGDEYVAGTSGIYERGKARSDAEAAMIEEANARLIAAAPELLEACIAIAKLSEGQGRVNMVQVAGQARAAIDKANGPIIRRMPICPDGTKSRHVGPECGCVRASLLNTPD